MALVSTNSFGAICIWYTDGFAFNAPENGQPISKCSACRNEFWTDDAESLPDHGYEANKDEHRSHHVSESEYPRLIRAGFFRDSSEEFHLRFHAWHQSNHKFRKGFKNSAPRTEEEESKLRQYIQDILEDKPIKNTMPITPFKPVEEEREYSSFDLENMERLLELLNESPENRVCRSEILRNLGRYDECLNILKDIEDPHLQSFIKIIHEAAIAKKSQPLRIS